MRPTSSVRAVTSIGTERSSFPIIRSISCHHPHLHGVVPGGGLSPDGTRWIACRPGFFLPVRVLLDDVGRYTRRVAIANQRLLDMDDGHVRFRYTDDRAQASQTTMTLDATACIRRVLLHVLPSGFHRRPL